MDRLHQVIGLRDDDRARLKNLTLTLPPFPNASKGEGFSIGKAYEVGLFRPIASLLPLDEPITGDQTTAGLEGILECRFFIDCFGPCIDGAVFGLGFLRRGRDQTPLKCDQFTASFAIAPCEQDL